MHKMKNVRDVYSNRLVKMNAHFCSLEVLLSYNKNA